MNSKQKNLNEALLNAYKEAYSNPKDNLLRFIASINQIVPSKLHIFFVKEQSTTIHNINEGLSAPLYDRIDSPLSFLSADSDDEDSDPFDREVLSTHSSKAPIAAVSAQTIGDISSRPLIHSWLQSLFVSLIIRFKYQRDPLDDYYNAPQDERIYLERDLSRHSTICIAVKNLAIFFLKVDSNSEIPISLRVEPFNSHSKDDFHFNEIKAGVEFVRSILIKNGNNEGLLLSFIFCLSSNVNLLFEQKCNHAECIHDNKKPPSIMVIMNQRFLFYHYDCYVNHNLKQ